MDVSSKRSRPRFSGLISVHSCIRGMHAFYFALVFASCASVQSPESALLKHASWQTERVVPGLTWKYDHFDTLFNSKQSVTVFEVDLKKVDVTLKYVESGFFLTSEAGEESGAAAAVNGSFFNTKTGGSVVFVQDRGKRIPLAEGSHRDGGALEINPSGEVNIIRKPAAGWDAYNSASTVLSAGPLLVYDREIVAQADDRFHRNRHPRTAIGLDGNKFIAVVVDGRSSQAYGMSTPELARLMSALGCEYALNLDGGGSSTAWVSGEGVVNYPSDNKKWDHEGERSVATALLFFEEN